MQSASVVEVKLLGIDKITACVKQICLLGVICKNSKRKILSGETFCILEKRLQFSDFFFELTSVFNELLIGPQQLLWSILLFSCNPICQLCLSGPRYSSRAVIPVCDFCLNDEFVFSNILFTNVYTHAYTSIFKVD